MEINENDILEYKIAHEHYHGVVLSREQALNGIKELLEVMSNVYRQLHEDDVFNFLETRNTSQDLV